MSNKTIAQFGGFFLAGISILLISACAVMTPKGVYLVDSAGPVKSDNDRRDYQYLTLSNQLRVLLISDPDADKAAASLDIHVGSGSDPKQSQGLAHFLEHMLFLGTEKYPEAGEYQAFISAHSGAHNAYTSFEHTNYFFDIDPSYLDQTLDRFSQFFIAPLFTETYVEREKNAVHSEYTAKIKNEQRKSLEVFKTVINPEHPFAKFSVGNLETLSVERQGGLRQQLIRFYEQYYSSNIMTLVVLGNEPLAELQEMVESKFEKIPNREFVAKPISEPLFIDGQLPLAVTVVPEQDQRLLSVTFPTPSVSALYKQKPLSYIGNILGHEGKGSLLSYLLKQGWAEGLSAGAGLSYEGGATFNVMVELTEAGVNHSDQVVTAIFQTINRARQLPPQAWLFDEQKALSDQQFLYQESLSPIGTVSRLANDMHYYPEKDVLRGALTLTLFDKVLISDFLKLLTPDNSLVTINARDLKTDKNSHYYKTPYRVESVDSNRLALWRNAGLNSAITLPAKNEFIASDFSMAAGDQRQVPELLIDEAALKLWFKNDDVYQIPKANINVALLSPVASQTPKQAAHLALLAQVLSDQLNEFSYPATLAGLSYSLTSGARGLSIDLSGFNDKQVLLLDKVLTAVASPKFDPQRVEDLRHEQIRRLENAAMRQPYRLLMGDLSQLLFRQQYSEQQLLEALQSIDLNSLKQYAESFTASFKIEALVYGNYNQTQANVFAAKLRALLALSDVEAVIPAVEVVVLPEGDRALSGISPYSDAAMLFYLQSSEQGKQARVVMGVASQWLKSDFYTQLRTEKQLGYIVTAGVYPIYDVAGLFFVVQSPVAGPAQLNQQINGFIEESLSALPSVSVAQFEQFRRALRLRLTEKPKNLWQQGERFWRDIHYRYSDFDSRDQLIAALDALTFDVWRDHMQQMLSQNSRRGVWLYSVGQFKGQADMQLPSIDDVQQFKANQAVKRFY